VIDLSNPEGLAWFHNALKKLQEEYKVDGFKFDAGDARFYRDPNMISHNTETSSNDHMELFASLGREYKLNELRASWKLAGEPIAQRLRDKKHNWEDLQLLIPHMITMSNMGYAYTCPDMIGGGEYQSFKNIEDVDQELIVRSAQASALMPMMQFSVAPWRVLNDENASICLEMAKLHTEFGIQILDLAKSASETGLPILRSMEFNFPGKGYENILDQFMIGENLIVAPVLQKGAISRVVQIPEGTWKDIHGQSFVGPQSIKESVSLGDLPHFTRVA
jgi:alpha-glucosidase